MQKHSDGSMLISCTNEFRNENSTTGFNNYTDVLDYVDLKTGKTNLLKPQNITEIFFHDPELYNEFNRLSESKQRKLIYSYVLKFNKRNPLYIPLNPEKEKSILPKSNY